jgi:hypothetical protein
MSLSVGKALAKDAVGTSAAFAALTNGGVYTSSSAINLYSARYCTLFVKYLSDAAAGATGTLSVIPIVSAHGRPNSPTVNHEAWFPLGIHDGSVTGGTLVASSLDTSTVKLTEAPDWGRALHRGLDIRTEPADGNSEKTGGTITLAVGHSLWLRLLYAEATAAAEGTAWISYVLWS